MPIRLEAFALTHILIEVARAPDHHDPDREQDRQRHNDFHRFVPHGKNWRNKKLQAITCGGRECANTECGEKKRGRILDRRAKSVAGMRRRAHRIPKTEKPALATVTLPN